MSSPGRPEKQVPVRSLSETAFKEICRQLEQAFTDEKASASFVCGGTIPMVEKLISVYWRNGKHDSQAQVVDLPVPSTGDDGNNRLVHSLVASCEAASFGRNKETVMDPEYRKAGKLELDQFATTFHPADHGILDEIAQNLVRNLDAGNAWLVPRRVEAELYKLNVYSGPSGLFQKHVDTPLSENQIGSLVVCLPSPFKGGNLMVRHNGSEVDFAWEVHSANTIQWAAFYSDCEHEIKTVSEGHRITLTYNLYAKVEASKPPSPVLDARSLPMYGLLKDVLQNPGFMKTGGVLGAFCAHSYPHAYEGVEKLLPQYLKGSDLGLYAVLHALGFKVEVLPVVVMHEGDEEWGYPQCWNPKTSRYKTDLQLNDEDVAIFVGPELKAFDAMFNSGEEDYRELFLKWFGGQKSYEKPITWISDPQHPAAAMAHINYSNQAEAGLMYSYATIIAEIPAWNERQLRMQELTETE